MSKEVSYVIVIWLITGALIGGVAAWYLREVLPIPVPVVASSVRAEFRPNGHWRVSEILTKRVDCELFVIERRFKDEVLDDWISAQPLDSHPPQKGSGISEVELKDGPQPAWAEYQAVDTVLRRGIYNVVLTATGCENGFNGTYAIIPGVRYDFIRFNVEVAP
jgi:hypothetical protein